MSATIIDIADAVVAQLEGATFTETPAVIERVVVPLYKVDEQTPGDIAVKVLPKTIDYELSLTRSVGENVYTVYVAIYRQTTAATRDEEVVTMLGFVQEVSELLRQNIRLTAYPSAALSAIRYAPLYDAGQLDATDTFLSVLECDYGLIE